MADKLPGPREKIPVEIKDVRGLDDAHLGTLVRALAKTGAVWRKSERSAHCPPSDADDGSIVARREFWKHMERVDGHIGQVIVGAITFSDLDPTRLAMFSKSAAFRDGKPVLYWEHWGTEDLDDPGRDPVEFQMFVGLNGHLETEEGKKLAHHILGSVLEDYGTISSNGTPSDWQTFGSAPADIFAPFVRSITSGTAR